MGRKVGDWYHYSGVIHVHTTESDGTKSLEEVVAIGRQANLDFLMFSDHMGLTNREAGLEGMYGDTLVVVGYEHNDLDDNNHYLIFDSPGVYPAEMAARDYVAATKRDGAFGLIAHPIEHRSREGKHPPFPWLEWETDEFDGLEIWNQMSEWMEKLTRFNQVIMAFSPRKSMVGPTDEVLRIWDRLAQRGQYVGVAGVDAHAFPINVGPLTVEIFPSKVHFRALRTHIILGEPLSEDFATARRQLFDALRACRVYNSNMRWGAADDFQFFAQGGAGTAVCGGALNDIEGARIVVRLPSRATIKLICNGEKVLQTRSDRLEYAAAKPGLYRVEAWKGRRGWIFSNHIRLGNI
jgi:hypothetical protein